MAVVGALAFLAFALRVYHLGQASLWYDEANTVVLASFDPAALVRATAQDAMPPLYYLLLHFWLWDGAGEFWLRFPSRLAGSIA